jgi:pentatricopeptide repeat protein
MLSQKEVLPMAAKELKCLGIAMRALMKAGMYDAVEKIIDTMAETDDNKEDEKTA